MKRALPSLGILGVLLGALWTHSPGGAFLLALAAGIAWALHRRAAQPDKRFVMRLFVFAFLLRVALSLGLDGISAVMEKEWPHRYGPAQEWDLGVTDKTRWYMRMGDSDYLSQRGYAIVQFARGVREPVVVYRAQQTYGWNGYAYVVGAFYALFGYSPIAVKWINCLLGAGLALLVFFLAKASFNGTVARWASVAVTLWPSLLLWSASNLKESSLLFLTALVLLLSFKIVQARPLKQRLLLGGLCLLCLMAHATLRTGIYSLGLLGGTAVGWILVYPWRFRWRALIVVGLLVGFVGFRPDVRPFFLRAFQIHLGFCSTPGISYRYLPEEHYTPGSFYTPSRDKITLPFVGRAAGRAIYHYLVEPLPKRMDSLFSLAWYPIMAMWYLLLPLILAGFLFSLFWNAKRSLYLICFLGAWILLGALTNGNAGTVLRMRDMVLPFLLILASAGGWGLVVGPRALSGKHALGGSA